MYSLCRALELLSSSQTCKLTHWSRPGEQTCSSTSPKTRSVALATRRATVLQQGISMWVFLFHPSAAIPHISYHGIEFFLHSAEVWMKCGNNLFDPWLKVNSVLDCPPCDHGDVLQRYPYIFQPFSSFTVSVPSQNLTIFQKISEEIRSHKFLLLQNLSYLRKW